jgi:hypothetical protein
MKKVLLTVLAVAVAGSLLLLGLHEDQLHTHLLARARWGGHTSQARLFFAHAARVDSAGMADLVDDLEAVKWGLTFGRVGHAAAESAATTAIPIGGGTIGEDAVSVDYLVLARWCPAEDEPHVLQLHFTRRSGEWRISYAGAWPC